MAQADDSALAKMRAEAVGQELDEELAARYLVKEQYDWTISRPEGDIHVYVYVPEKQIKGAPAFVNMHGGGFVKGYRGRDIVFSRNMAYNTRHLVIDVDYRTAPEKKYPYALHEGYDAIKAVLARAGELGIDPERVILSGQSAGANLITGIAFLAKEKQEFVIAKLLLAYPPMDLLTDPMDKPFSDTEDGKKRAEAGRLYNDWYIDPERRGEICASPILASADDLKGLPPFVIMTAEKDSLGREAEEFALKLIRAGVTVTARRFPGAGHGFLVRRNAGFEQAEQMIFDAVAAV